MKYGVEMTSCDMIFLPSFMKICAGVQAILRFRLSNMNGCNVGITDEVHRRAGLRWHDILTKFHKDW
jgi:hypothetical protein